MQNRHLLSLFCGVVALVSLTASPGYAENDFCWKDSYGRGVGTVPGSCGADKDRIGLLCYDKCPAGMKRFGFDCHSVCPSGMADQGLFCRRLEYGRGAGYPWKFGDALNDSGMFRRCEQANGKGKCEKWGAVVYPKCKPGYSNFGCCICRPAVPNCKALGLRPGIDLSCAKVVKIGSPTPGICASGEERDAGLCYPKCRKGYSGVGPVCWVDSPKGWVNCGMGAAKDSKTCASVVFSQVGSVGQLAVTVATLGSSYGASSAANAADKASKLQKLKDLYEKMVKAYEAAKKAYPALQTAEKVAKVGKDTYSTINKAVKAAKTDIVTEEDIARTAALIASIVDSSGVSATIAAYTYPKCSKYFGPPGK